MNTLRRGPATAVLLLASHAHLLLFALAYCSSGHHEISAFHGSARIVSVKLLLCAFMLATPWAFAANEITDRADVDKLIFALKDALGRRDQKAVSKLLASDTNRPELSRALLNLNPGTSESADKPWSESSRPILMINTVRFPEKNLAEVDTAATQYGSVANRNANILFLLKREKAGWRIESMRAGPPPR